MFLIVIHALHVILEYDHLSSMCKTAENSFLSLYKTFRDAPDPVELVRSAVASAEGALVGFRRVEEIFDKIEKTNFIETAKELDNASNSIIKNDEEFQDRLKVDIAEVASTYDIELKKREQIFRDSFEEQKLQAQQKFDSILAQKDAELLSLNETLRAQEQMLRWNGENNSLLQAEIEKREIAEHRLRESQRDLEILQYTIEDFKMKQTEAEDLYNEQRASNERLSKEVEMLQESRRRNEEIYSDEISSLKRRLEAMPSFDLTSLADKLGISTVSLTASDIENTNEIKLNQDKHEKLIQWTDVEEWLIATIRRSQSEASELRVRDYERKDYIDMMEAKVESLSADIKEKQESIDSLERDLNSAYSSIEAGKALLRCHKMADSSTRTADAQSSPLFQIGNVNTSSPDVGDEGSKEVRMMKAVLEQRDRMMKQAHAKEQEASSLQMQVERLENDKAALKQENTELYKRLRVIRANTKSNSFGQGPTGETTALSRSRMKKRITSDYDEGDDIEAKYAQEYEENIDLFKLEELDRQAMISRMNACEKGLSHVVRFMMQDKWMRHAFLVYVFLVHLFALGYVCVVLNPDIEREIDEQWSKISKQEQNYEIMHPDNWA